MNKLFVGLDISFSGTGIVIIDDNKKIVFQKEISTKKHDNDKYDTENRIFKITNEALEILQNYKEKIKLICIEDISFGSIGQGSAQLIGLNYFIRLNLIQNNFLSYHMVEPKKLKKFVTGTGNAKKQLMLKEVYKKWGADFNSDNLADAFGLAMFALHISKDITND